MAIPIHDLWWLAAGGSAGYGARYMKARIDAALTTRRRSRLPDPTGELLRLQTLYGHNPYSLASIAPSALLWSTPEIDGAIIYGEFGRVWLVAGDPLAPLEDMPELARQFAAFAKRKNRVVAFVPASAEFARLITPDDFTVVKVGASPYFDLQTWNPRGDGAKKLRAGVNQARRAGVAVEMISASVDESLKKETAQLCMSWLSSRRSATTFGWLIALDPFLHSEYKKYFAARVNGKLVGFLAASPIPARKAWYLEDVLREPEAPQGTATLLVVEALAKLKAEGVTLATLGTSPLATDGSNDVLSTEHRVIERALRLASQRLGAFYNFEGLRRFKGKFVPSWWESEYALGQRGAIMSARVAYAIVRALVPGGVPQLLTRQAARMIRGSTAKLCVQLLLCSGLFLSSFQSQSAQNLSANLSDDARTTLNRKISVKVSGTSPEAPNSGPETQSERSPSTSKFVTVDGTRLHFVIKGAGRPVVLIHGNPGSGQDWTRVLGPLAAHHKAIAFDRPGHGLSQRPKHGDATVEVQARLLHDALKQLHVERPIVVGHSWGGALALVYAINYPKEVAGVVLVAPAAYKSQDVVSFLTNLAAVPVIGDAANSVLTPLIGASVVRSELKKAFSPDPVPKSYLRSVLSEWTRAKKVKWYSVDDALLNDCLTKISPRYSEISVPVSILAGDSDLIVSEKENAERLHQAVPKSHLLVLPKTGHQIPFTRPQAVVDEIERVQRLSRVKT